MWAHAMQWTDPAFNKNRPVRGFKVIYKHEKVKWRNQLWLKKNVGPRHN
jgi:hypothetical protein